MPTTYQVRPLTPADKSAWLDLWHNYIKFYQTSVSDELTENTFNNLLANENMGCLVACDENNKPIGMLNYVIHLSTWDIAPMCYLQDLFVDHAHRKGGAAKKLLHHLQTIAQTQHWSQIYWITTPDNVVARKFYDQVAKGETWIYYSIV